MVVALNGGRSRNFGVRPGGESLLYERADLEHREHGMTFQCYRSSSAANRAVARLGGAPRLPAPYLFLPYETLRRVPFLRFLDLGFHVALLHHH